MTIQLAGKLVTTVKVPKGQDQNPKAVLEALKQASPEGNKRLQAIIEVGDIEKFKRVIVV